MFRRLLVLGSALMLMSNVVRAESYAVDPVHAAVIFKVSHANTSNTYGRFNQISGTVDVTDGAPTALSVTVAADSIDTGNKKRDEHLTGPDFFNVKEFPEISFKSTAVKKVDENNFEVVGDLTLHGTTKPITVKLAKTGSGTMQGKSLVGFETSFTIKRSEYGMTNFVGKGVGDEVTLIVAIEAAK